MGTSFHSADLPDCCDPRTNGATAGRCWVLLCYFGMESVSHDSNGAEQEAVPAKGSHAGSVRRGAENRICTTCKATCRSTASQRSSGRA